MCRQATPFILERDSRLFLTHVAIAVSAGMGVNNQAHIKWRDAVDMMSLDISEYFRMIEGSVEAKSGNAAPMLI